MHYSQVPSMNSQALTTVFEQSGFDNSLANVLSTEQPKEAIEHVIKSLSHRLFVLHLSLYGQDMDLCY